MALFAPTETQEAVKELAREYAQRRVAPEARENDAHGRFPFELLREMAGLGLMGVNIPAELGGSEAGSVAYALAMMEVARADAATSVTMAVTNMVGETLVKYARPEVARLYVPKLCDGTFAAGAFALSEPHAGSDPGAMRTTARRDGDRWVINGAKQWITSGSHAGVFVVWARTSPDGNQGISAFAVPGGVEGLTAGKPEDKMGLKASNTVALSLEDVVVGEEALLGNEGDGFRIAMSALDGGRIGIGSQAVGIGRRALDESVAWAKERQAFGKALGEFQATQWKLADMATELDAAELLVLRAAALKEQGAKFTREASMAKLFASEAANRAVAQAVQIHGGYGYVREYAVERCYRDARVTTIYEGTSEVQRLVIAREVLREQAAAFDRI